ncbi:uncharacterized protein LOC100577977 isoform X2 [Apis mellifera]|uniref:Uncharacterized protein LOC100577977 isoform X2 n=1 Tax=Apis mellifera TaxID=7460 RepID=A0A7M7MVD9_APIME|nr:uncharacterized protein LOC100577977 isoform X2 [Apis mellifera]|eukprot:XP_026301128.1 uncharacterized protein LOC100577977 isoform X2 [Apis mellifera]
MTLMFLNAFYVIMCGVYSCSFDYLLLSRILFYVNCAVCRLNGESKRIALKNADSDNCMVRDQEVYFHRRLYRSFAEKEISGLLSMNGQHSHGGKGRQPPR